MFRPIGTQFEMPYVDWWGSVPPCAQVFVFEVVEHLSDQERCELIDIKQRPLKQQFVDGILTWCYADDGTPYTGAGL